MPGPPGSHEAGIVTEFKTCPACGASVKLENLDRHLRRAHPGRGVEVDLSEEERDRARSAASRGPLLGSRERLLYPLLALVLVVVVVVGVVLTLPPPPEAPETAPAFTLPSSEGEPVSLSAYAGSVIFLNFMDVDCSHCRMETADVLIDLHRDYGDRVVFLSVSVGFIGPPNSAQDVEVFRDTFGASWTFVLDDGSVATPLYGIESTPTNFVLRRDMSVQGEPFIGASSYAALAARLDVALGG